MTDKELARIGGLDPAEKRETIERLYDVLERLSCGEMDIYDAKYNLRSLLANEYYRGKANAEALKWKELMGTAKGDNNV